MADLDEEELGYVENGDSLTKGYADELMGRMAQEIRRRRAADLSDADREALRLLRLNSKHAPSEVTAVLDRLIRGVP